MGYEAVVVIFFFCYRSLNVVIEDVIREWVWLSFNKILVINRR